MTSTRTWTISVLVALALAGCGGSSKGVGERSADDSGGSARTSPSGSTAAGAPGAATGAPAPSTSGAGGSGAAPSPAPPPPATTGSGTSLRPGVLTAGAWDDNLNFDFYLKYLQRTEAQPPRGLPLIPRADRMSIQVIDADGKPVTGADVTVFTSGGKTWKSITGADGRVLYFPRWAGVGAQDSLRVMASFGAEHGMAETTPGARSLAVGLRGQLASPPAGLDLAFVIDTTGSMGDEIRYLQVEFDNIVADIARLFPNVSRRYALVVYKDDGDPYVERSFDFTPDAAQFRTTLSQQSAGGGGDYPEASDRALLAANRLAWRPGATARVLFWVADAPHHAGKEGALISAFAGAVGKGIHIYPVAASGTDDLAEFSMRTGAEVTGGRYIFLTDDSGVGGAHKEPRIPCYFVTSLQASMRRMLQTELTGVYVEPAREEIIRTGGDPQNRMCKTSGGDEVVAF